MTDDRVADSEHVTYSPAIEAYVCTYDDSPSMALVEALEDITDADTTEFDTLHEAAGIEADALDDLFRPTIAGAPREGGRVEFVYHGYEVRIYCYGRIEIEPLADDAEEREDGDPPSC